MSALVLPAGVRVEHKHFFPDGLKVTYKQMVNDSIAKIRGPDLAKLGIGNGKADGLSGSVIMTF